MLNQELDSPAKGQLLEKQDIWPVIIRLFVLYYVPRFLSIFPSLDVISPSPKLRGGSEISFFKILRDYLYEKFLSFRSCA